MKVLYQKKVVDVLSKVTLSVIITIVVITYTNLTKKIHLVLFSLKTAIMGKSNKSMI